MRYLREGFLHWWGTIKEKWKQKGLLAIPQSIISYLLIYYFLGRNELRIEMIISFSILVGTIGAEFIKLLYYILVSPFRIIKKQDKTITSYQNIKKQIIEDLVKLRTEGVKIRNKGETLMHKGSVDPWWQEFLIWKDEVKTTISKIDRSDAESWYILDKYTPTLSRKNILSPIHKKRLDMFDTWLRRLKILIDKYQDNENKDTQILLSG